MLRTADPLGPTVSSPLSQFLRMPMVPTGLGFDARLQFLHETDLLQAVRHATVDGIHGTFNIAGDGILMMSQVVRRLGRPTVPVPGFAMGSAGSFLRKSHVARFSAEHLDFLTYGRGVDTSRMRHVLEFEPTYTSEQAFSEFACTAGGGLMSGQRVTAVENFVAGALGGGHG
jgi:UDP-glucose 4-epimerase